MPPAVIEPLLLRVEKFELLKSTALSCVAEIVPSLLNVTLSLTPLKPAKTRALAAFVEIVPPDALVKAMVVSTPASFTKRRAYLSLSGSGKRPLNSCEAVICPEFAITTVPLTSVKFIVWSSAETVPLLVNFKSLIVLPAIAYWRPADMVPELVRQ